jgi:uncharacterized membrane protein (UPF0136 family)
MGAIAGFLTLVLGLCSLGGGLYGYFKADSKASLIAGGICGIVLIVSSRFIRANKFWPVLALLATGALLYRFAPVFWDYKEWFPHGIMTVVAAPTALALIAQVVWGKKPK